MDIHLPADIDAFAASIASYWLMTSRMGGVASRWCMSFVRRNACALLQTAGGAQASIRNQDQSAASRNGVSMDIHSFYGTMTVAVARVGRDRSSQACRCPASHQQVPDEQKKKIPAEQLF